MQDCIFCKIVKKEIPAKIVHEDEISIGFLDVSPRSKGMCIVVPKEHFPNFDDNFELASKTFDSALSVAEKVKKSLSPLTVFISIIQAQVPHFHIRVYPVYKDQIPLVENKPIEVSEGELSSLAEKIKSVEVEWKGRGVVEETPAEEPKKEKKAEEKRKSEEDIFWLKRSMEVG